MPSPVGGCGRRSLAGGLLRGVRPAVVGSLPELPGADPRSGTRTDPPGPHAAGVPADGDRRTRTTSVLRGLITAHKEEQALQLTRRVGPAARGLRAARWRRRPGWAQPIGSCWSAFRRRRPPLRRRGFDATRAGSTGGAEPARLATSGSRCSTLLTQRRGTRGPGRAGPPRPGWPTCRRYAASRCGGGPEDPVILFDDVVTTGASLTEAARVLRAAGSVVIGACTVAATHGGASATGRLRLRTD